MKKHVLPALLGLLVLAAAGPILAAGPVDIEAGLDLYGKYVWRGQVVTPDPVLQPMVMLDVAGVTAGFLGNIDSSDVNETEWKLNEVQWLLGWGMSLPKASFGFGFLHYAYPEGGESTTELYLHGELGVPLSPRLAVYQDIDTYKGAYWQAAAGHGFALNPTTDLNLDAALGLGSPGYVAGYFGFASLMPTVPELPGNASMTDFAVTASVPLNVALFFTVTPSVSYTTLLGDVKDVVAAADGETDAFFWGLSAMFRF